MQFTVFLCGGNLSDRITYVDTHPYVIHILARFCAGDDYAGRAYSSTLQQLSSLDTGTIQTVAIQEVFAKERAYIDALAGKSSDEGRFPGDYKLRRERISDAKGIAVGTTSENGAWEVGLF